MAEFEDGKIQATGCAFMLGSHVHAGKVLQGERALLTKVSWRHEKVYLGEILECMNCGAAGAAVNCWLAHAQKLERP